MFEKTCKTFQHIVLLRVKFILKCNLCLFKQKTMLPLKKPYHQQFYQCGSLQMEI